MFVVAIAGLFGVVKGIELINRVLEDHVITPMNMKKAASGEEKLYSMGFDVVLTTDDIKKLEADGIIQRGAQRHHCLAQAGKVKLCEHCNRLQ